MSLKIFTDSTCDIVSVEVQALSIHFLPLRVHFGEDEYFYGMKKGYQTVIQRMLRDGVDPRYPIILV